MSIADKLTTIAENEQRVYKAGQLNVLANAECLNGSLSGKGVSANDVNSIEHNVKCDVSSKNLWEFKQGNIGAGTIVEGLENGAIVQGNYAEGNNNSWANGWYQCSNSTVSLKAGDVVTLSCDYTVLELADGRTMADFATNLTNKKLGLHFYCTSGGTNDLTGVAKNQPTVLGEPTRLYITYTVKADGSYYPIITLNSNKVRIENIQIEYGSTATTYEPYITDFSSVKVSRYGKNLFEFKQGKVIGNAGVKLIENLENGGICQGTVANNTTHNAYSNGWYTFDNISTLNLKVGDVVTVSCDYTLLELAEGRTDATESMTGGYKVGIYLNGAKTHNVAPSKQPKLGQTIRCSVTITIDTTGEYYPTFTLNSNKVRIENIQIEVGSKPTNFEKFKGKQTVTANADGTVDGITSIAPSMTLLTDNSNVTINANYYKDPDIVISNLAQNIALTGGEG